MRKHVFIDMDGTIVEIIGVDGKVSVKDFRIPGFFNRNRPNTYFMSCLKKVFPESEYEYHILSASPTQMGIIEKDKWLDKYFAIDDANRHFIFWKLEKKNKFILKWCIKNGVQPEDCILVDDELQNLIECEWFGIVARHTSWVMCESEEQ